MRRSARDRTEFQRPPPRAVSNRHVHPANFFPMKKLLQIWSVCFLVAGTVFANAGLAPVAFVVATPQFKAGDAIVIDQVLATSPNLGVGDQVVVRGHYQLASTGAARLGLLVTHATPAAEADKVAPAQMARVTRAAGTFELSCAISFAGRLHVSFYPVPSGEAFGGVYIQPE